MKKENGRKETGFIKFNYTTSSGIHVLGGVPSRGQGLESLLVLVSVLILYLG